MYRLVDQNNNPFYIGITNNPTRRYKEHLKQFKTKQMSKFKGVSSFTLDVLFTNTNRKFNIKLVETWFILWDKLFGSKLLKNQYIY